MKPRNLLDGAIEDLSWQRKKALTDSKKLKIRNLQMELRFLKMLFWFFENWEYTADKSYVHLASFLSRMEIRMYKIWHSLYYDQWLKKSDFLIPQIQKISIDFLHNSSIKYKKSTSNDLHGFLVTVHENLVDLLGSKAQKFVPLKEEIQMLKHKLRLFTDLVKVAETRCINREKELQDFRFQVQYWVNKVACLLFLYWVVKNEEELVPKLRIVLEIKPFTPMVKRGFLGALKASKPFRSENFLAANLVANFVDLVLEDVTCMEESIRTSLRDGLIILITFLMDPPMERTEDGNEILAKVETIVDEASSLICFLYVPSIDFLERIKMVKEDIREQYVQIQDLSLVDFPKANVLGFIDFLLENLQERENSISFAKFRILEFLDQLLSVRRHLNDLVEQQRETEELKHLWTRITNVAYAVEHVIDSCFFEDVPIWHKMIHLSIYNDEVEFISTEVRKIRDYEFANIKMPILGMNSSSMIISAHGKTSRIHESIVGFKDEAAELIDQLTRGSEGLKVVSIVGMPGKGKTTLANKIYNDPSVKYYFNKRAWCFVSQAYQREELLQNIVAEFSEHHVEKSSAISEDDLAEKLYKCLKGQRYLIVMDDIWDIKALDELQESFPNDKNGSRIVFTSRIHSMASRAKFSSYTHFLCPLSIEESWELLQKKLFGEDCCPKYLSEIGMTVAESCEGLPLSLVVTAGILATRVMDLDW